MTKYFIEMKEYEEDQLLFVEPEIIIRLYVENTAEAEAIYTKYKGEFDATKLKSRYVEMNHNIDPTLNKPCIEHAIVDGKVEINNVEAKTITK